ncbi:MAG: hypothetical protein KF914_03005 [Rhizobiaceae bacterium]|nr:hypothetical protein [Rhizobiaceae bacterium]
MVDRSTDAQGLLRRRLGLVADLSALNAEALRHQQALAGVEMEALRCEIAIGRGDEQSGLVRDLHEAQSSARSFAAAKAGCEDRMAAIEDEIRAVDEQIAALGPG